MAEIIASTYEILKKIGEGGGGIVYLANHMRLQKLVVMKADKRDLRTSAESLSREVSLLKNLNHTYIPQVYDFFVENGVVYTVIDYIEGESLDKPLMRGERFEQPKIVEWACEILEALVYLHGQTPGILHADIKPSNIMITPKGDIRLIDFNISLLLKESGAVRVGYSWGYASPEHYGADYRNYRREMERHPTTETFGSRTAKDSATLPLEDRHQAGASPDDDTWKTVPLKKTPDRNESVTELLPREGRENISGNRQNGSFSDQHKTRTILLDVRSDIYSLGATLYHMICGVRPANDARDVIPLRAGEISDELCRIINKAMAPDPDQRYQTAAEMLYDLEHLHEHDPRTKRLRKIRIAVTAIFTLLFLAGGAVSLLGLLQEKNMENARVRAKESQAALQRGDPVSAASLLPEQSNILTPVYVPEAQAALAEALGVYDLSDGFRASHSADLSSETLKIILSPTGTKLCALCAWELSVYDAESGKKLVTLPIEESALSSAVFIDDNRIAYSGPGALRVYDLSKQTELWHGKQSTAIAISADGSCIASVYKDESAAYVYDAATGVEKKSVSFGEHRQQVAYNDTFADPRDNLFALNDNGSLLAVSFAGGGLYLYDLRNDEYIEVFERSSYSHFEGGFYGKYFVYSAIGGGSSVFTLIDTEKLDYVGSITGTTRFGLQVDESGISLSRDNLLVQFDPETLTDRELAFTDKPIVSFRRSDNYVIVATEDKRFHFFDASACEVAVDQSVADYVCDHVDLAADFAVVGSVDTPTLRFLRLESHPETDVFHYDPSYQHMEARLSADGNRVMLFQFDRFGIFDVGGEQICDVELPDSERIYDQQYRRVDGASYLEVIWYDGIVRQYSAEDGSLISEEQRDPPDESLYEEFFTSAYRITSPLHGTPCAYDRETGALIQKLEKDSYLTYVTETEENIITEYITAQGERFGILLDKNLQTIAKLPQLCDVVDGQLLFDYSSGALRGTHIYSLQELLALAAEVESGSDEAQ